MVNIMVLSATDIKHKVESSKYIVKVDQDLSYDPRTFRNWSRSSILVLQNLTGGKSLAKY